VGQLRTGSLESLRERNRLRVIDALRTRGAISRADIARQTGLSRSTVSSLVADLQAAGMVVERATDGVAATASQGGRPPVLVALDRAAGAVVGIDFGHDSLRVAVADLSYAILAESFAELEVDTAAEDALDTAATLVSELIDEAAVERGRVLAAGMGLPGPIDRESGLVHSQPILPGWVGLDPAAEMEERLGLPVHLDNDANVGALGESTFGVGRGTHVMAYLRLSAGIGAGLVINGRPFRGARGIAGEIGHVLVDPQGPICRCGNRGCLETFLAAPALRQLDDDAARAEGGARLASVLTPVVTTLGIADVVLYGPAELLEGALLDAVRSALAHQTLPFVAQRVQIRLAPLDDELVLTGAAALVRYRELGVV